MPPYLRPSYQSLRVYALALVAVAVTTLTMVVLRPYVHPFVSPPFLFAVLAVAWFAGLGPAVVTGVLGAGALAYLFVTPVHSFALDANDAAGIGVFLAVAAVMAWLAATVRRARDERVGLLAREHAARTDAQEANRVKDVFLAILAHEFRTPLAAIRASVAVLDKGGDRHGPAAERSRAVIRHQAEHLARLVDDLLDVNQITSGRIAIERRPLDLAEAVRQSVTTVVSAGRTKDHVFQLDAESVWVEADPVRIERVLVNLLDNAVKYTPAASSIAVRVRPDATDAVVEVADPGIGIPPEILPRIFDLMVQADSGGRRGGLGIGLAVVRRLVELHDGTITAASEGPGRGSRFTVRLPRAPRPPLRVCAATGLMRHAAC